MRVLLLGKFPPGQGGIASKTYWLYRALSRRGFIFDVVTLVPDLYASRDQADLPSGVRLSALRSNEECPWFIPGGGLETERLITAAIEMAEGGHKPDIVECNYLAPYGMASLIVSRLFGVPLIVRHAGSDLAKLLKWAYTRTGLERLLASADLVVSNVDAIDLLKRFTTKIAVLPRYITDPEWFCRGHQVPDEKLILYAGKLNYYWKLKALDSLLSALRLRPSWRLLAVAGGKGRQAFEAAVKENGLEDRVRFQEFVSPHQMPGVIAAARLIWAVERQTDFSDFSNIIWEAVSLGRTCLVSPTVIDRQEVAPFRSSGLLLSVDPEDPASIASSLDRSQSPGTMEYPDFQEAHRRYIDDNADIYETVCQRIPDEG